MSSMLPILSSSQHEFLFKFVLFGCWLIVYISLKSKIQETMDFLSQFLLKRMDLELLCLLLYIQCLDPCVGLDKHLHNIFD